ncbi:hypothetical protein NBRC13719_42740 (plasmid) [Bacillus subtilis subsp. subtilis]|nr:hypothetical protein NBRC13719_42740 [Bacillus subtilis subsp. subtilis]
MAPENDPDDFLAVFFLDSVDFVLLEDFFVKEIDFDFDLYDFVDFLNDPPKNDLKLELKLDFLELDPELELELELVLELGLE